MNNMDIPNPSPIPQAEQIKQVLTDVPPVRLTDQQEMERKKTVMKETIAAMESSREKIGNFCTTIGAGEEKAVLMNSPVMTQTRVERSVDGRDVQHFPERHFILVTPGGFREICFQTQENNNVPYNNFRRVLTTVQEGVIPGSSYTEDPETGRMEFKTKIGEEEISFWGDGKQRFQIQSVEDKSEWINEALKRSVDSSVSRHKARIDTSRQTIDIAGGIRQELATQDIKTEIPSPQTSTGQ